MGLRTLVRAADRMGTALLHLLTLLSALFTRPLVGLATRFGDPGDRYGSSALACDSRLHARDGMFCAHRTLPCGTLLLLENPRTGLLSWCRVMDRGPYGARLPDGGWTIKMRPSDPGSWRGSLDLSPSVSDAIGHNGFERVLIWRAVER